jgi:hypothetical protein
LRRKLRVWHLLEFVRAELLVDNLPDNLIGRHIGDNGLHRLNQENNPAGLGVDKFFVEVLRKLSDFGRSREKKVSAEKSHVPNPVCLSISPRNKSSPPNDWILSTLAARNRQGVPQESRLKSVSSSLGSSMSI